MKNPKEEETVDLQKQHTIYPNPQGKSMLPPPEGCGEPKKQWTEVEDCSSLTEPHFRILFLALFP